MRRARRRPVLHVMTVDACEPSPGARVFATGATVLARIALVLAVLAGGAVAVALLILLLSIASPLAALLLAWIVLRTQRDAGSGLSRLRARWGRSARIVPGGLAPER